MIQDKMHKMKILSQMPERKPVNGTFELTVRCNLKCKMCLFRHQNSETINITKHELTAEQWINMAKQVAEAGTLNLLISGGEPMLRPDFCEIWEGVYKQGFVITLYTNATLVTPKVIETLTKYPPHRIGFTIYGASEETYRKVCGNAGAYQNMIDGVQSLLKLPSLFEFRKTIIKDNLNDIDAIDELVLKKFKKNQIVYQTNMVVKAVRGGCSDVEKCRLPPEESQLIVFKKGAEHIKRQIGQEFDPQYLVFSQKKTENTNAKTTLLGCSAGTESYTITWDGKLIPCQIFDLFQTDAIQEGFRNAWEALLYKIELPETQPECEICAVKENCQVCYAYRYAETKSLTKCPEYIKRTAEYRKKAFQGGIKDEL